MINNIKRVAFYAALIASINAHAAGFGLIEQGASMGNGYAGGAVAAEDASTVYFNPAGMTYLPDSQLVLGLHVAKPSINFTNNGSTRAVLTGGLPTTGGNGGDGGGWAFIPNIYYVKGVTPSIKVGVAISPLFGLKAEYDSNWVGRYQAIKSDLKTLNINPSIAFKASERVSLGFGVTAMRAQADLTNAVDFGTLLAGPFQGLDGLATVKGDGWGWGWNMGAIFQLDEATRLGLAYRSAIHTQLKGGVAFGGVPTPLTVLPNFKNGAVTANFVAPESVSASLLHHVNDKWDVMADVIWTRWSRFKDLTVTRETGAVVSSVPENWQNVTRVGFGASYQYSGDLKLRAGMAYDESPIDDQFRTPRVPDSDRIWLSLGLNYKLTPVSSIDLVYTHIAFKNSTQNKVTDASVAALQDTLKGDYDNDANIFSAQYSYNF